MKHLQIENKSAKLRLGDVVSKPVIDELLEDIGKVFGAQYTGELTNCAENAADTLDITIHSPGGSVFDGYTLYNEINELRQRGVYVTATINTLAASMASVIAMAADKIRITQNGRMMIHDVSQAVRGNSGELRQAADLCESMSSEIAGVYSRRTGLDQDDVRQRMKKETWMDAGECVAAGFADELFDTEEGTMSILAKLFPGNDHIEQIEAQIAENDTLRADLETAQAKVDELTANAGALATAQTQIQEFEAKVVEQDATIADLTEKATITEAKVSLEASELLAATGHPEPVDIVDTPAAVSLREQYNSLTDEKAKADFRKAHWSELISN